MQAEKSTQKKRLTNRQKTKSKYLIHNHLIMKKTNPNCEILTPFYLT